MARSNMTRNDWLRFGTVAIVAVVALYLLYPFWPLKDVVDLGLDLQGGVRTVWPTPRYGGLAGRGS